MRVHAGRRRAPPPSARSGKKFQRLQKEKEALEAIRLEKLGEAATVRAQDRSCERLVEDKLREAAAEKREQAKALMPKKHKRLLQRIETTASTKNAVVDKLKHRAEQLTVQKKIAKK